MIIIATLTCPGLDNYLYAAAENLSPSLTTSIHVHRYDILEGRKSPAISLISSRKAPKKLYGDAIRGPAMKG